MSSKGYITDKKTGKKQILKEIREMLKSKVVKAVATGVVGVSVVATVWTGGDIIQRGIDFITGADAKVEQAVSNINLLKSGITTKNEQIATLNGEIESLKEQIANNDSASHEQIEQLQEQLNNKIAEVERLTQEVATLTTEVERLTQENTSLKGELDKANADVERLKEALDGSRLDSFVIDSTEEIQALINSGEVASPEEADSIVWSVTGSEHTKHIAQAFLNDAKETIENHLKGQGVNLKGISIDVEGAYEMSGTNLVTLYVRGASPEAKEEITKNKLNAVLGSKSSIENLIYR